MLASRRDFWLAFRPESPHDVYLADAAGAGLPALAAYLVLLASVLFVVARADRTSGASVLLAGLLAAASAHLVTDLFMTADVTSSWLFWLLIGAGVGYAELARPRTDPSLMTEPTRA